MSTGLDNPEEPTTLTVTGRTPSSSLIESGGHASKVLERGHPPGTRSGLVSTYPEEDELLSTILDMIYNVHRLLLKMRLLKAAWPPRHTPRTAFEPKERQIEINRIGETYDEASFHAGPEPSLYPPLFENQYFDRNQTSVLISSKTLFLQHDRLNAELRFDNYLGSDRVSEDGQIQMCGEFTLDFKSNTDASVRPEYRCFQMSPTSRGSVLQGELTAEEAWGPPLKLIRNFVLTAYKYQTQYRGLRAWVVTRAFADAEYQYSRLVRPLPALPTSRSQDKVGKLQLLGQNQTEAAPVNDARTKDSRTREGEEALESAAQSAHVLPKGAAQRNFLTDRTEAKEGETEPQQMEDVETEVETPLLEGSGDRGWDSRGKL